MSTDQVDALYDYKKFAVVYVDDEEASLAMFKRAYGRQFRILTASGADEGLALLKEQKDDIGLLITDQRMPVRTGTWLLEQARKECPHIVRVLATAYSDMEAAIAAVNSGGIYRYITKPWDPAELEISIKRGLEFFMVRKERDELLRQQLTVLRNAMIADRILGLGFLAQGLSHHIRNGLVAVKAFLDLAPTKMEQEKLGPGAVKDPEFWKSYHGLAQAQIDKVIALLKELWSASEEPGSLSESKVDLRSLINEVVSAQAENLESKQIQAVNEIQEAFPTVPADEIRFRKLFDLLLKDEISMLPEGCRIEFSAEVVSGAKAGEDDVVIQITDNGPGLPKDQLRMVFDPFMVRNDSPMEYGINLMSCFIIVHHHGGKIDAETMDGGGTRFRIRIPLNSSGAPRLQHDEQFLQKLLLNQTSWDQFARLD